MVAKDGRTLTPEQARTLLAAVRGERKEALVTIMLAYGLRPWLLAPHKDQAGHRGRDGDKSRCAQRYCDRMRSRWKLR